MLVVLREGVRLATGPFRITSAQLGLSQKLGWLVQRPGSGLGSSRELAGCCVMLMRAVEVGVAAFVLHVPLLGGP